MQGSHQGPAGACSLRSSRRLKRHNSSPRPSPLPSHRGSDPGSWGAPRSRLEAATRLADGAGVRGRRRWARAPPFFVLRRSSCPARAPAGRRPARLRGSGVPEPSLQPPAPLASRRSPARASPHGPGLWRSSDRSVALFYGGLSAPGPDRGLCARGRGFEDVTGGHGRRRRRWRVDGWLGTLPASPSRRHAMRSHAPCRGRGLPRLSSTVCFRMSSDWLLIADPQPNLRPTSPSAPRSASTPPPPRPARPPRLATLHTTPSPSPARHPSGQPRPRT